MVKYDTLVCKLSIWCTYIIDLGVIHTYCVIQVLTSQVHYTRCVTCFNTFCAKWNSEETADNFWLDSNPQLSDFLTFEHPFSLYIKLLQRQPGIPSGQESCIISLDIHESFFLLLKHSTNNYFEVKIQVLLQ